MPKLLQKNQVNAQHVFIYKYQKNNEKNNIHSINHETLQILKFKKICNKIEINTFKQILITSMFS